MHDNLTNITDDVTYPTTVLHILPFLSDHPILRFYFPLFDNHITHYCSQIHRNQGSKRQHVISHLQNSKCSFWFTVMIHWHQCHEM